MLFLTGSSVDAGVPVLRWLADHNGNDGLLVRCACILGTCTLASKPPSLYVGHRHVSSTAFCAPTMPLTKFCVTYSSRLHGWSC